MKYLLLASSFLICSVTSTFMISRHCSAKPAGSHPSRSWHLAPGGMRGKRSTIACISGTSMSHSWKRQSNVEVTVAELRGGWRDLDHNNFPKIMFYSSFYRKCNSECWLWPDFEFSFLCYGILNFTDFFQIKGI